MKIFASVGHNFEALPGAQIIHIICRFEAWEVRNLVLQTVHDLDLKRRSYGRLKTNAQSTNGNFAAKAPFRRWFRSCETPLWHTSAISQPLNPISQLRNGLRKWHPTAKIPFGCEMFSQPHSYPLPNPPCAAKMAFCYQMIFKLPNGY